MSRSSDSWPAKLGELLAQPEQPPTLSEIMYSAQLDRTDNHDRRIEVVRAYDRCFKDRPDYQLLRSKPRGPLSWAKPTWVNNLPARHKIANIALDQEVEPAILWGVILQACTLLVNWNPMQFPVEEFTNLLASCRGRLKMPPLCGAEAASGVLRVLLQSAIDRADEAVPKAHGESPVTNSTLLSDLLDDIEKIITREIDTKWRPGKAVAMDGLDKNDRRYLLATSDFSFAKLYFGKRLSEVFSRAQSAVRNLVVSKGYDPSFDELLARGWKWSISAWRQKRANRIATELKLRELEERGYTESKLNHIRIDLDRLYSDEMHHLSFAANAAQGGGYFIEAAALNYLLLQVMREEWLRTKTRTWEWFFKIRNQLYRSIRQVGLRVPTRSDNVSSDPDVDSDNQTEEIENGVLSKCQALASGEMRPTAARFTEYNRGTVKDLYRLRFQHSREKDLKGHWRIIFEALSPKSSIDAVRLLHTVCYEIRGSRIHDARVMKAALELCLEFGWIKAAGWILHRRHEWSVRNEESTHLHSCEEQPISNNQFLRFTGLVTDAVQVMPHAIDLDKHKRWRQNIANTWRALAGEAWTMEERLVLHESMHGVCAAQLRGAKSSRHILSQYYDWLDDDEVQYLCHEVKGFTSRGVSTMSASTIQKWARDQADSELGAPVILSVVSLGDAKYSLIAISADKSLDQPDMTPCNCTIDIGSSIENDWADIVLDDVAWALCDTGGVEWSDGLLRMGHIIVEAILCSGSFPKWVMLAVSPELATIAWNLLLHKCWADSSPAPVVSIVPSFTWIVVAETRRRDYALHPWFVISSKERLLHRADKEIGNESALEFENLRAELVKNKEELNKRRWSAAIVLGHGSMEEGDSFPTIVAPDSPIPLRSPRGPSWLRFANYRMVVAHSCFGGWTPKALVADLGGPGGVVVSLGTRLFCGPILQVSPRTALSLQRALTHAGGAVGGTTIASRYRAAFLQDEMVGLYNLYGFPTESGLVG